MTTAVFQVSGSGAHAGGAFARALALPVPAAKSLTDCEGALLPYCGDRTALLCISISYTPQVSSLAISPRPVTYTYTVSMELVTDPLPQDPFAGS